MDLAQTPTRKHLGLTRNNKMPQIPTSYGTTFQGQTGGLQFNQSPQIGSNVAADQLGTLSKNLVQGGADLLKAGQQVQFNIAQANTLQRKNDLYFGVNELVTEFNGLNGKAAVDGGKLYSQKLQDMLQKTEDNIPLESDVERRMFQSVKSSYMIEGQTKIAAHGASELKKYEVVELTTSLQNSMDTLAGAVDSYKAGNDGAYATAKFAVINDFNMLMLKSGVVDKKGDLDTGSSIYKAELSKVMDNVHKDAVTNLVRTKQLTKAADYFEKYKDNGEISTQTENELLTLLGTGVDDSIVFATTQKVIKNLPEDVDLRVAQAEIDAMVNNGTLRVDLAPLVMQNIKAREAVREAESNKLSALAIDKAKTWLQNNRAANPASMPGDIILALKQQGQWAGIVTFAENRQFVHNPVQWVKFSMMPPAQLATITAEQYTAQYRTIFDDSHFDQGLNLIKGARTSEAKGVGASGTEVITVKKQIEAFAIQADFIGSDLSRASDDELNTYSTFQDEVQRRIEQFETTELLGKRKVTFAEVDSILSSVYLDRMKRVADSNDTRSPIDIVSEIDFKTKQQIKVALTRQGLTPNARNIAEFFLKGERAKDEGTFDNPNVQGP